MLTSQDKDRIEAAVTAAECQTRGDIICALAGEVSRYREVPLAFGAIVALALPPLALALGLHPLALMAGAEDWGPAQTQSVEADLVWGIGLYAVVQAVLFVVTALIVDIPAVRRLLTPKSLKRHRVAMAAHHHFQALSARAHGSETGVLIFVAQDDRQVQVLAHAAIHKKAGDAVWTEAAGAISKSMRGGHDPTSGIVRAVELCGAALAQYFPADGRETHVFSNRPMDI